MDEREPETGELAWIVQLLVIQEYLHAIQEYLHARKADVDRRTAEALALVCTEDTIQAVKAEWSALNKEFAQLESWRKAVKAAIMKPYEDFEAVYEECVSGAYRSAGAALKERIRAVEEEIKRRCEEGLREYFAELCAVHHLDWLEYERAGIKVDMASARARTPKKLMEQLAAFVTGVADSEDRIRTLEDAEEILLEFRKSLDAAAAICTVKERHRQIEEARAFEESRRAIREQEAAMVRRVEALAPPVAVKAPAKEDTIKVSLILHPTPLQFEEKIKPILKQLKQICDMEGIQYE